jgi:hypothetical protein
MPPGTADPSGQWRKVNIRGKPWPHTPSWVLISAAGYAASIPGQIETVIDSGGWLPGLEEVHILGYVPGGWTIPLAIDMNFQTGVYLINGTGYPLSRIFVSRPAWGSLSPASLVPGTGLTDPAGGQGNFSLEDTLAHALIYLGMGASVFFSNTAIADFNLCFTDEACRTFAVADGIDTKTGDCRFVSPQGIATVHNPAVAPNNNHKFDVNMTTTTASIMLDRAPATTAPTFAPAAPEAMCVVGRVAGPLVVTRMTFRTLAPMPVQLPALPTDPP